LTVDVYHSQAEVNMDLILRKPLFAADELYALEREAHLSGPGVPRIEPRSIEEDDTLAKIDARRADFTADLHDTFESRQRRGRHGWRKRARSRDWGVEPNMTRSEG
jgi:hypothetical protein